MLPARSQALLQQYLCPTLGCLKQQAPVPEKKTVGHNVFNLAPQNLNGRSVFESVTRRIATMGLLVVILIFGLGFVTGYAIRSGVSHHRRTKAERQRLLISH